MSIEEIASPPYPGEGTTAATIYFHLEKLGEWVEMQIADLNPRYDRDVIARPKRLPEQAAYVRQSVISQFGDILFLRRLREAWDRLIREYEHEWDSAYCIQQRVLLVQTAVCQLNQVLLSFEAREARKKDREVALRRTFDHLTSGLAALLEPLSEDPVPG